MTNPRTDWSTTSFSELSTLAHCEEQWRRKYQLRGADPSGAAATKGTLFHVGTAALLAGDDVAGAVRAIDTYWMDEVEEGKMVLDNEVLLEAVRDATWLVKRYARHYAVQLKRVRVVASELEITRSLHYPYRDEWHEVTIKGRIDTLLDFDGQLWLREAKTSTKKDILDFALVSPQISLYWWLLEDHELVPPEGLYGVLLDYAYAYRWKAEKPTQKSLIEAAANAAIMEGNPVTGLPWTGKAMTKTEWAREQVALHPGVDRPDSESFEQLWLDRTPQQVQGALSWAQVVLARRHELTHYPTTDEPPWTVLNLGGHCRWCPFQAECYEDLSFPQDDIVIVAE